MATFVCYNTNGKTSATNENKISVLSQWDTNRTIVIREIPAEIMGHIRIHFCNSKDVVAYVVVPEVGTGYISAVIPNRLLMLPDNIVLHIVEVGAINRNEVRTLDRIVIPVVPRPMPSEYIYAADAMGMMVADGLTVVDNTLHLSMDGVPFGTGVELEQEGGNENDNDE